MIEITLNLNVGNLNDKEDIQIADTLSPMMGQLDASKITVGKLDASRITAVKLDRFEEVE
jgi:hypothetical protein